MPRRVPTSSGTLIVFDADLTSEYSSAMPSASASLGMSRSKSIKLRAKSITFFDGPFASVAVGSGTAVAGAGTLRRAMQFEQPAVQ